jgi:acetyl esterase/lipase
MTAPPVSRIRYGPAPSQFGDLRLPEGPGPHPVVVGLHGGWWRAPYDLEPHGALCAALTADGFATWNVEYRRVGEAGGGWPGTFEDAGRAVDFLAELAPEHHLDLSRVVTVGFSAGGHLALWVAGRHRLPSGHPLQSRAPVSIRGAVSLAGAVDLIHCAKLGLGGRAVQALLGGALEDVPERYATGSPSWLLPLGVPQSLLHGTADTLVPPEVSERYHAIAVSRRDDVELQLLPGAGHFDLIDPGSGTWPAVRDAVRRRARGSASADAGFGP